MELKIEVFGDVQVSRKLLRWAGRVTDASPAFREIAQLLRRYERRQFTSQGAFASGGWAPDAESTVRLKAAKGLDPRILHATGDLEQSLTGSSGGHVEVVAAHQLVFGTSVPYARFHQTGTSRMPRRRPLEIRERDRAELVRIIQQHLVRELG